MTDTQVEVYFYSDLPRDTLPEGSVVFRLPYESFPQQIAREEFWRNYRTRQAIWLAASKAIAAGLLIEEELQKYPAYKDQKFTSFAPYTVNGFEMAAFGRYVTKGSNKNRAQFWYFVGMQQRGITPSDLLVMEDTVTLESEENRTVEALLLESKLEGGAAFEQSTSGFERQVRKNKGPNSFYRANTLREWANMYLGFGYPEDYVAQAIVGIFPAVLCKPFPPSEPIPSDKDKAFFTLGFLHLYFINRLQDIVTIPAFVKKEKEAFQVIAFPEEVSRSFAHSTVLVEVLNKAIQFYEQWPDSTKARVREMADRGSVEVPSTNPYGNKLAAATIDREELDVLGKIITSGSTLMRRRFWQTMQAVSEGHRTMDAMSEYTHPRQWLVKESAIGFVKEGHGLNEFAKLLDYGRQGLSDPIRPLDFKEAVPKEEQPLYQMLSFWIKGNVR